MPKQSNDTPYTPHHQHCMETLRNLRDQLECAELAGVRTSPNQSVFKDDHFKFWREQIDAVLDQSDELA